MSEIENLKKPHEDALQVCNAEWKVYMESDSYKDVYEKRQILHAAIKSASQTPEWQAYRKTEIAYHASWYDFYDTQTLEVLDYEAGAKSLMRLQGDQGLGII